MFKIKIIWVAEETLGNSCYKPTQPLIKFKCLLKLRVSRLRNTYDILDLCSEQASVKINLQLNYFFLWNTSICQLPPLERRQSRSKNIWASPPFSQAGRAKFWAELAVTAGFDVLKTGKSINKSLLLLRNCECQSPRNNWNMRWNWKFH